ncbi:pilus assembly protein TadG-related protein [Polynucleobacter kasalickyi]|uniref:Putative Flp pilus-assembly TadE/G-like n=1 Tax=Polynucleobacter kasalickyi TaxID=1938817 RepID=A0A1W1Y3X8_9BURK|nr:pilus assembly protein TadG-related protein [Polynucleobacter kasalickyi]SMC30837.1 Putative Flp pilus-assembly TadE/G-like [Polynucleobacter kasalickyi]
MISHLKKIRTEENASVIVISALLLAILIGFMGLAIDISYAFYARTKMQSAADASALGAASSLANGGSIENALLTAQSLSAGNGFSNGSSSVITTPTIPPGPNPDGSVPSYSNDTSYARVKISQNIPLFFAPVIGFSNTWAIQVNAVAGIKSSPACLVTIAGFTINGTNIANLNNCSAAIGRNLQATNQSKIVISGTGSTSVFNGGSINCNSCSPTPVSKSGTLPTLPVVNIPTGLSPVVDPTCSNHICQPGIYNAQLILNKGVSYTFTSGFYLFNNGISTNSAIVTSAPNGVTLYVAANQPIDLSGTLNLSAQTPSGCTPGSGILIYQSPSTITSFALAGSKDQLNFNGIIDLPSLDIKVSGTSSNLTLNGSIIAHSLDLNGNMSPSASSNSCNNFISENKVSLFQ